MTSDWESAAEVRAAVEAWVKRYNHERPHQALSCTTPAEYRAEKLGRPRRRVTVAA